MVKTTTSLPEGLDRRLEARAGSTGTSEAELVRRAVARLLDDDDGDGPGPLELPVFSSGRRSPPEQRERAVADQIAERVARR